MQKGWILGLGMLVLSACATIPAPLRQQHYAPVSVAMAQSGHYDGQPVRWGGEIVAIRPHSTATCFEVVSRPLNGQARPRRTDQSDGRFIACVPGFYDPAIYTKGREITVTGVVQSPQTRKIGAYDYRYARVAAQQVYLWPIQRPARRPAYRDPFWDPFFWGPGPYYGPWPYW